MRQPGEYKSGSKQRYFELATVEGEECYKISTNIDNVFFYISKESFNKARNYKWTVVKSKHNSSYRVSSIVCYKETKYSILARYLLNAPDGVPVDHKNRNPLDNRLSNLRLCTNQENMRNKGKIVRSGKFRSKTTSKYKGVFISIFSSITIDGKNKRLGSFETEEEAALAYNEAAKKYHGEFAVLNEI